MVRSIGEKFQGLSPCLVGPARVWCIRSMGGAKPDSAGKLLEKYSGGEEKNALSPE